MRANFVSGACRRNLVESLRVEGDTEGSLDTRAQTLGVAYARGPVSILNMVESLVDTYREREFPSC